MEISITTNFGYCVTERHIVMLFGEFEKNPYVGLRIGVKFYFYESSAKYKKEIRKIFEKYCDIADGTFLFCACHDNLNLKSFKKEQKKYFNRFIDSSDFESSRYILFTNATLEQVQSVKCEMMLSNIDPDYIFKLPNEMYFEFLPSVCYENICSFVRFVCETMDVHYCCCNALLGTNDHYPNKSKSMAVKLIQNNKCLSDRYSVWSNRELLKNLKFQIDGPNAVQVLSKDLYSRIGRENLINKCKCNNIYCQDFADYIFLAVSSRELAADEEFEQAYIALYNVLKDIIIDMKKPQMYWKAEDWIAWRNRFNIAYIKAPPK